MPAPRSTAARLADIMGGGRRGAALAARLAREGLRPADLRKPEVLARMPRDMRARVLYRPERAVPRARAAQLADELARRIRFGGVRVAVLAVGSVRRGAPRVKDIDLLAIASRPERLGVVSLAPARSGDRASLAETFAAGPRRRALVVRVAGARARHHLLDVFVATPAERPFAMYHFTGPAAYNVRIRAHAKRCGWLLNQYGLWKAARRVRGSEAIRSEQDLARFLRVTYRDPADRE